MKGSYEKQCEAFYHLPISLRPELKKPLGLLIQGDVCHHIREEISKQPPPRFIAVGDVSTETFLKGNIIPDLSIVDNKVGRKIRERKVEVPGAKIVRAKNPSATITANAWTAIKNSLNSSQKVELVIDGEEDLLVIPAVIESPPGSIICYGQPGEGVVLIRVTEAKRFQFQEILKKMIRKR